MSDISAGTSCVSSSTFLSGDLPNFLLTFPYTQHSFLLVTSEVVNDPLGHYIQEKKKKLSFDRATAIET